METPLCGIYDRPKYPQKSVRVESGVNFSGVYPKFCLTGLLRTLLPGKSANKLSFLKGNFSEFIFHDILAHAAHLHKRLRRMSHFVTFRRVFNLEPSVSS